MTKNKLASQSFETKANWKAIPDSCNSSDCKVNVVEPRKSKSISVKCPNCKRKSIFKKKAFFAEIFARWTLEMKLSHYKIDFVKTKHPLNCLRKYFTSGTRDHNVSWKFNSIELTKLNSVQLLHLKRALEKILEIRNKELGIELEERAVLGSDQKLLKTKSVELESLARNIMKPYVNIHPLCEELARLMLA